jgi:hypothetical protein
MKTASTRMQAFLASSSTTLCRLYKITRTDGNVYTFTDHDENISTVGFQDPLGLSGISDATDFPSIGGYEYEAAIGFSPTASQNKNDLSVDNQTADCFIDSVVIQENEVLFGFWDAAQVEIRAINWADLTMGEIKLRKGTMGNITMKNGLFTAEILGLSNNLQILTGYTYGSTCDAELGDSRCKAVVPTETGSVNTNPSIGTNDAHHITPYPGLAGAGVAGSGLLTVVTENPTNGNEGPVTPAHGVGTHGTYEIFNCTTFEGAQTYTYNILTGTAPVTGDSITITGFSNHLYNGSFTIGSVVPAATSGEGYYADGVMTFTSGNNSGLSYQIKDWDGVTLTLDLALFTAPANGDTFVISPGCGHNVFDCLNKFNNLPNHRGFPTIPGMDSILNYPDASGTVSNG